VLLMSSVSSEPDGDQIRTDGGNVRGERSTVDMDGVQVEAEGRPASILRLGT
jgi:hypothetical protein